MADEAAEGQNVAQITHSVDALARLASDRVSAGEIRLPSRTHRSPGSIAYRRMTADESRK